MVARMWCGLMPICRRITFPSTLLESEQRGKEIAGDSIPNTKTICHNQDCESNASIFTLIVKNNQSFVSEDFHESEADKV